jgi:uncharacterized membrane protein
MIWVTLYSKEDCHFCDQARDWLNRLQDQYPHQLIELDIARDKSLTARFGEVIPVIEVGPYTLETPFTLIDLKVALAAASTGTRSESERQAPSSRDWAFRINRAAQFFTRHWVAIFNTLVFLYISLPFFAPALMQLGYPGPANIIYKIYSPLCHQLAYRSWFLFGEQPAYPSSLAEIDLESYTSYTGLAENDLLSAKNFIGNAVMGYKVALCQRDIAIYGGIFVAGLLFSLIRKRVKPIPILLWFLIGIVPIALDGGSQLLRFIPFDFIPVRESTPLLRTITGFLFGIMSVWLAYPYIEESMQETNQAISTKLAKAEERDRMLSDQQTSNPD